MKNNATTEQSSTTSKPDPLKLAYEVQGISPWRQNLSGRVMRHYVGFWGFIGAHWLFILNIVNAFCLAAAFAAPLLLAVGLEGPGNALYSLFHYVCAQNPNHSFYLADRQMCICQRCMAIYGTMLFVGLGFYFVRERVKPLKVWQFALLFCPPIAVDGFSQLFGWRESTWELRFLTGGWFAVGAVWTLYPLMEQKMAGLRRWVAREQALTGDK